MKPLAKTDMHNKKGQRGEVDPPVRTTGPRFLIGSAAGPIS